MKEPEVWSKREQTELEQQLLEAAKGERIPSELKLRMGSVLTGIAPELGGGATSSVQAGAASAGAQNIGQGGLLFSKAALWGFLTLMVLAGTGAFYATRAQPRAQAAPASVASTPLLTAERLPAVASGPTAGVAVITEPILPAPALGGRIKPAGVAASERLRQEIALLDRVREALADDASARAWRLLEQHQQRFPHGVLQPEAEMLRVEALVRRGETQRAQQLARRFTSTYPQHPLRERVSGLVAAAER